MNPAVGDSTRPYAADLPIRYLGVAQAYRLADPPGDRAEVFSLVRGSDLDEEVYLDAFMDTGTERQRDWR